jgi:Fe-S-cluster-containing dehydrogenase component/CRP-like cAMP-binding protein
MANAPSLDRPRRWNSPFAESFDPADIDRLMALAPFNAMNPENFPRSAPLTEILRNDTAVRRYKAGELIVRQGDYGTSAFLILKGKVHVVLKPDLPLSAMGRRERSKKGILSTLAQIWTNPRESEVINRRRQEDQLRKSIVLQDVPLILRKHETATLTVGQLFGEIAALSRIPRTVSICAESAETELLEIRWQGLRDLLKYDTALRQHVERDYRKNAISTYLHEIPFLKHLKEGHGSALEVIAKSIQFETYGDYDWSGDYRKLAQVGTGAVAKEPVIVAEGDYPNHVIMIRSGFARVTQRLGGGHRTLNYLGAGHFYGLAEIAHNWRHPEDPVGLQHTLRALGHTHVLTIPAAVILEHVLPQLPASQMPPPIVIQSPGTESGAVGSEVMEFLTQNRFFNGTKSMVIDLDRCTRCDDCVRACASTHDNNPRFLRHGPILDNLMVAQACMHCTDPVCMIGCPTGAIHRDPLGGEVVINPDTCIGCSICANNCPYDSIRMVELRDEEGEVLLAKEDGKPILQATKCDLCLVQLGGPACVRACPHDALERIDFNTLGPIQKWLRRK